ncbi:hypothetical protein [Halalkalibacter akibai]|uniref:Uncharacterized protein n=1 Tax=Halalkalibacter akibai (strain ATCC 43226 / DSM 21942 / CIP 109018 / JCM 9157 / 1139) TaxID=1236973 RepID=W4QWS3_HALA3|nr:hypothetical protein [Halalkalibacter akibai]GAE35774.1 hypothetical protein JCM9157_2907 [Halalkalibacter akibai JCM 9157]
MKNNHLIKAILLTFLILIITMFKVDVPILHKLLSLIIAGIASFKSIYFLSVLTSNAYKKFENEMTK